MIVTLETPGPQDPAQAVTARGFLASALTAWM